MIYLFLFLSVGFNGLLLLMVFINYNRKPCCYDDLVDELEHLAAVTDGIDKDAAKSLRYVLRSVLEGRILQIKNACEDVFEYIPKSSKVKKMGLVRNLR